MRARCGSPTHPHINEAKSCKPVQTPRTQWHREAANSVDRGGKMDWVMNEFKERGNEREPLRVVHVFVYHTKRKHERTWLLTTPRVSVA